MTKDYLWTTQKLKHEFLTFFKDRNHLVMPSTPVVPKDDPSLLFVNSGMVQFKTYFLNADQKPPAARITTSQHCIRAGGKHNDLEDVGKDNYHHTFFEMLGNWSFGDYGKEQAIDFAYEFLVSYLKLNPQNLYVTVFDEMDSQSRIYWRKYFPEYKIINSGKKDNFWEMGEYGPCGPCTEIHYDRIGNRDASSKVNKDDPDVLEIWNLVFMEFEKVPGNSDLIPLGRKCVDTGIGLERLLSILNNVKSNYLIDSFQTIIHHVESLCDFKYSDSNDVPQDVAFRIIADHSRTIATCLYYQVEFSNVGVGYVLRRLLRRMLRYSNDVLKIPKGELKEIVKVAFSTLQPLPPIKNQDDIFQVIEVEENQFFDLLKKGTILFNKIVQEKGKLSSEDVFTLYDTHGFPIDLTKAMAEESKVEMNLDSLDDLINEAKEKSRNRESRAIEFFDFDFPPTDHS